MAQARHRRSPSWGAEDTLWIAACGVDTADTEDPGTFTTDESRRWVTGTVAIKATAGGTPRGCAET